MAIRVGRMTRIAGFAGAAFALSASVASARPVTLWGCHGPLGQALGASGLEPTQAGDGLTGAGCAGTAGVTATFSRPDPAGGSRASWRAAVPAGTTLQSVRITRTLSAALGPYAGAPQRYAARASGALEALDLVDTSPVGPGVVAAAAAGGAVSVGVQCDAPAGDRCSAAAPGAVSVDAIALDVDDTTAPRGAVGGLRSPVRGALTLEVDATDDGAGLAVARAIVDGRLWAEAALDLGCADLDPGTPVRDVPLTGCAPRVSRVPLHLDLTALPVGPHRLQVRIVDAAANEADAYDGTLAVAGPDPVLTPTVRLAVGDPRAGNRTPSGEVQASRTTPQCAFPRLSMMLDQRPVRISRGRPVLRASRRYRFRGRLTCRVAGTRRGALHGTPVELLNRIGRRVWAVTGATTASGGRITMILAYRSSRTLIFRHRASTGTSQVRIPIVVSRRGTR
jgi:hypothetical protein